MSITFTDNCTFQEYGVKNKVNINTINSVHHAKCECGNEWESIGAPKVICDKCTEETSRDD